MTKKPTSPSTHSPQKSSTELSKLIAQDAARGQESWLTARYNVPILSPQQIPKVMEAIQFTRQLASAAISLDSLSDRPFDYSKADMFLGALWGELKTLMDGGESEALQPIGIKPSRRFESAESWRLLKECGVISLMWMKKFNHPPGAKIDRIIKDSEGLLSKDKITRTRLRLQSEGALDAVEREFDKAAILNVDLKCIDQPVEIAQQKRIEWILYQVSQRAKRVKVVLSLRQERKSLANQKEV